jgi:hypothetical protein
MEGLQTDLLNFGIGYTGSGENFLIRIGSWLVNEGMEKGITRLIKELFTASSDAICFWIAFGSLLVVFFVQKAKEDIEGHSILRVFSEEKIKKKAYAKSLVIVGNLIIRTGIERHG